MSGVARQRLGEMLIEEGLLDERQLQRALDVQRMGGGRLGSVLVRLRFIDDLTFRKVLRRQLGVEIVDIPDTLALCPMTGYLPVAKMRKYEVIPLAQDGEAITLGMRDPYDAGAIEAVRAAGDARDLRTTLLTDDDFDRLMGEAEQGQALLDEIRREDAFYARAAREEGVAHVPAAPAKASVAPPAVALLPDSSALESLASYLLLETARRGGSEIHVEPTESGSVVRARVDGRLVLLLSPPRALHGPLVGLLRSMAGGPPRVSTLPWQGRIVVTIDGRRFRLRVATLPSVHGEICSVRLTSVGARPADLSSLPLTDTQREAVREVLDAGRGLVLTAGPGGAGSGATLRALLQSATSSERTAVALEESVDAPLDGVVHVELALQPDASPAAGLRMALLHRPDVVMIEDLDEAETAQGAVRAAQKGTLVLADLVASGAAEALVRLFELGVEPFNVASAAQLVVAQRSVRTVCHHCKEPVTAHDAELRGLGASAAQLEGADLVKSVGCASCHGSGFEGREPLIEVLRVTEPLRRLLRARAGHEALRESARLHGGFETMAEAGLRAVLAGRTTAAELRRALA